MRLTSANKGADMLAPHTEGRRYRSGVFIHWTRSPSGATHTGTAGKQRFIIMPDGRGAWLLNEIDETGRAHILEHDIPSDWSAMVAAVEYVHLPVVWPVWVLAVAYLAVVLGAIYGLITV